MTIKILTVRETHRLETVGFRRPFGPDRLCEAIGPNLGGNHPDPAWFDGWDILVAIRQGTTSTPHMPTAALLRRSHDGALRIVASDHISRGDELGADLIIGPQHSSWAMDALSSATDDADASAALRYAGAVIDNSTVEMSDEPANLLAERMRDDDLADTPRLREMSPLLQSLREKIDDLQSADRRSSAQRTIESLTSLLTPRH